MGFLYANVVQSAEKMVVCCATDWCVSGKPTVALAKKRKRGMRRSFNETCKPSERQEAQDDELRSVTKTMQRWAVCMLCMYSRKGQRAVVIRAAKACPLSCGLRKFGGRNREASDGCTVAEGVSEREGTRGRGRIRGVVR